MKPDKVKIIQIVVQGSTLLGLGDDGNIYRWVDREWAM